MSIELKICVAGTAELEKTVKDLTSMMMQQPASVAAPLSIEEMVEQLSNALPDDMAVKIVEKVDYPEVNETPEPSEEPADDDIFSTGETWDAEKEKPEEEPAPPPKKKRGRPRKKKVEAEPAQTPAELRQTITKLLFPIYNAGGEAEKAVRELLSEFGVAKFTEVPENKLPDMHAEALKIVKQFGETES